MDQLSAGLSSILPFLPISISTTSSSTYHLTWPEEAENSLKELKQGPAVSHVDSGAKLFEFISKLCDELGFSSQPPLAFGASNGFSIFFDQHMSREDAKVWFDEVVPGLAVLLLQLPSLLEDHYKSTKLIGGDNYELRVLGSQDAGMVILHRELIAALLACAFLCLFPTKDRSSKHLPAIINFDKLFATLVDGWRQSQQQKVKCFVHYFQRICKDTPDGVISFERKLLPLSSDTDFWKNSGIPLCPMEIFTSGSIEDQRHEALEVVFSNEYFGGNSLYMGCVQEQIRFMINPELVGGMLFLACMEDNEAVEVVGVEQYIQYTGYGSSFRFLCEYFDHKPVDSMERRKSRIVAMDALNKPSSEQYCTKSLLREINKAYVGFKGSKYEANLINSQACKLPPSEDSEAAITNNSISNEKYSEDEKQTNKGYPDDSGNGNGNENTNPNVGIATGNWGCGVFGGTPQIKCIIQWIAASQSNRPFIHYYTFNEGSMQRCEKVIEWITSKKWTVGDLWRKLVEYSSQKLDGETTLDFFSWILPADNSYIGHLGYNTILGPKRDQDPSQQDDRPHRTKRKPVWMDDYVSMKR